MRILIANDDGYLSTGINALQKAMSRLGESTIVAPDRNCSGASNSLTLKQPITVHRHAKDVYAVEGTPADCVNIALSGLLDDDVDIVVSGINDGPNMGDDVLYSGTVAAAMEARFLGHASIALSMASHSPVHFDTAALIAEQLVKTIAQQPLSSDDILNVNVPDVPMSEIKGIACTRLGTRHQSANAIRGESPRGDTVYWIGPAGDINDCSEGTDFHAVSNNFVSVTPLNIDMTDVNALGSLDKWLEKIS